MKKVLITSLVLAAMAVFVTACNNNKSTVEEKKTSDVGHEHVYRCPMHPEVTGKEGDTCPKCGMKLEHMDEAPQGAATAYFMQFAVQPSTVEPGKDVALSFTPRIRGRESEAVPLDIEHEKKVHLILVRDDLSWFDHIHPEYQSSGAYTVTTKFPAPGKYKAFADYKPTGASHVVDKIDIEVKGTAGTPKQFNEKMSGTSGNYGFEMRPTGGKLVTGALMHISGVVLKDGKEIDANSLDNYLGAKAHFVMISIDEKEYLHVHPTVDKGKFDLHTTFTKPGKYRAWVQFNDGSKIHTIDFTFNVTAGTEADIKKANEAHSDHHTQ
jgi:hypothetical protein